MQNNRKVKPPVLWENHAKSTALSDPNPWTDSSTEGCIDNTLHRVFNRKNKLRFHLVSALLTISLMQLYVTTNAQRITINSNKSSIKQVFQQLEKQSGYSFFYKDVVLDKIKDTGVKLENGTLPQALDALLKPNGLDYEIVNKTVVIKPAPKKGQANTGSIQVQQQYITGKVLDENGKAIEGASIRQKNDERKAVKSNADGSFTLPITALNEMIVISYVGYENQEIKAALSTNGTTIRLKKKDNSIDEVIVTGLVERKKESFTGATATYSGKQLLAVGNQNLIQGLRTLDPSFIQLENNKFGSNPNVLPNIEIRGKTSISSSLQDQFASDPNQPLFILDGFETSLRTIVDLNMNRVASVTILKDAASTAMYGSKASNGVVVIETVKPKPGQMRLAYSSDLNVEMPDLRGYNMMNASEKLEFERLSGRYTFFSGSTNNPAIQIELDSMYNARLAEVKRGVNTYWLNEPIHTGFSQRHSLYADGGDDALRYGAGISYKKTSGAMKNSGRDDWAGNIDLNYRKGKINIFNQTYISGYTANESNYGSFSTWVNTNPYYRKLSSSERYLENSIDNNNWVYLVSNPLYNAALNSVNQNKDFSIQNNLQLIYTINSDFRIQGALQVKKGVGTKLDFLSPLNTQFDKTSIFEKGTYSNRRMDNMSYNANLMLTYGKVFSNVHALTANLRTDISQENFESVLFSVVGFPTLSTGNPGFAFSYKPNSKPITAFSKSRRNNILASANYAYDNRYLADLSFRYDGSTAFGSNKRYSPYFSGGLGWNIHNESFMKSISWVDRAKIYANIGSTGNQNFATLSSVSTFGYDTSINIFGQGLSLISLGNPNLKWQNTIQTNIGTDMTLLHNKLSVTFNAFQKKTDPLVVAIDMPSSTGINSYPINAGILNIRGLEGTVKYSPIYRPEERIVWTVGLTGTTYKSKYDKFDNQLASLNNKALENKDVSQALVRYRDGYSPDDLWAVRSMGIDPATGKELFLDKSGQYTFNYNSQDIVRVGNGLPSIEGVFSTTLLYKGFNFGMNIRYITGRDIFNTALYSKIENIDVKGLAQNQDRRALYDRWKTPGDIAQFKAISDLSDTPISSRFVQTERSLSGESINIGYNFQQSPWLKHLKLSDLRINAYANDIFRISTVKRERGIDYPFARSISFSINASF